MDKFAKSFPELVGTNFYIISLCVGICSVVFAICEAFDKYSSDRYKNYMSFYILIPMIKCGNNAVSTWRKNKIPCVISSFRVLFLLSISSPLFLILADVINLLKEYSPRSIYVFCIISCFIGMIITRETYFVALRSLRIGGLLLSIVSCYIISFGAMGTVFGVGAVYTFKNSDDWKEQKILLGFSFNRYIDNNDKTNTFLNFYSVTENEGNYTIDPIFLASTKLTKDVKCGDSIENIVNEQIFRFAGRLVAGSQKIECTYYNRLIDKFYVGLAIINTSKFSFWVGFDGNIPGIRPKGVDGFVGIRIKTDKSPIDKENMIIEDIYNSYQKIISKKMSDNYNILQMKFFESISFFPFIGPFIVTMIYQLLWSTYASYVILCSAFVGLIKYGGPKKLRQSPGRYVGYFINEFVIAICLIAIMTNMSIQILRIF